MEFTQSPTDTREELRSINFDLYYEVITSNNYLRTILFRQWYQALVDMLVVSYLYYVGNSTGENRFKRSLIGNYSSHEDACTLQEPKNSDKSHIFLR